MPGVVFLFLSLAKFSKNSKISQNWQHWFYNLFANLASSSQNSLILMFSIKANPAHFTVFDSYLEIALKSKIGSDFTSCCWIYLIFFLQGFWYLEPSFFFHWEKGSINTNYVSRPLLIYTPTQENLFGQQHSSKMDPFYTHVVNVTCQKLQKCWLLSVAYLLCICRMYLKPKLKKY